MSRRLHTLPEGITLQHRPLDLPIEWQVAVWHFRQLLKAAFSADPLGGTHDHPAHSEITGESPGSQRVNEEKPPLPTVGNEGS